MKITINNDYRSFKKGDVFNLELIDSFKSITLVGSNGSGKSTLIQTIRGHKQSSEEMGLFVNDCKKLALNATVESNYEKIFVLDSIQDDPNHFYNAADAWTYVSMGGMAIKDRSHGESSLINIHSFLKKIEKNIVKDKTLVILDEVDKGLSLKSQTLFLNFTHKLVSLGCHVILITHNVFAIRDSHMVYDIEKKDWELADKYVKELTGFDIKRIVK